jgi:hypothetical protein
LQAVSSQHKAFSPRNSLVVVSTGILPSKAAKRKEKSEQQSEGKTKNIEDSTDFKRFS